jgi:hypothetical protein
VRALAIVALAGCFDPKPSPGLPCQDGWCPPPEMCIAGTCSGAHVIDAGIDAPIDAMEVPPNYMFVTSVVRTPAQLGGIAGADMLCNTLAASVPLSGHYMALLGDSTTGTSAYARLAATGASGWIRVDGKPFALSMTDLMTDKILYPPRVTEKGFKLPEGTFVATGTNEFGGAPAEDCAGFTMASVDPMLGGFVDAGPGTWASGSELTCNDAATIYCFGTDLAVTPVIHPEGTARAFLSNRGPIGTRVTDLDAHCQADADSKTLGGTFKALVPSSTGNAASRIVPPTVGMPWVRLDGVTVTNDFTSFDAPLGLTVAGTYESDLVWSGTTSPTASASAGATCTYWTTPSGSISTAMGRSSRTKLGEAFAGAGPLACSTQARLYCFESR